MPSWHCSRIRRAPVASASARATSVLPTPGLALEQQRLLERGGEEHGRGQAPVGEVALPDQRLLDVVDGAEAHAAAAASSSARRHSTRARWRL